MEINAIEKFNAQTKFMSSWSASTQLKPPRIEVQLFDE